MAPTRGARGLRAGRPRRARAVDGRRVLPRRRRGRSRSCCRRRAGRARRLWARRTDASLEGERLTERQRALLDRLPGPAGADLGSLRRLEARGLVALEPRAAAPRAADAAAGRPHASSSRAEQAAALEAVEAGGAHLLHGVTGSGKTEVYLRAAEAALARGRGRDRARARDRADAADRRALPGALRRHRRAAALGAGGGRALRRVAAAALRRGADRGRARARPSSRPVADLGLVVVDEEHDASYKHEGDPRYDARRVAAERARRAGARLLAGSATPRPETWHALPRLTLPRARRRAPAAARAGARHARRRRTRCTPRRGARWAARASRSCCSTAAAGRTSSPAAPAGRSGSARSATSRSCCTAPRTRSPATTAATASRVPQRCDACGSLAVARYGAGTERLEARADARRSTCRSSGSTPTPPGRRTPCPSCSRASTPRPPGCCSARRWSPRATTSRT